MNVSVEEYMQIDTLYLRGQHDAAAVRMSQVDIDPARNHTRTKLGRFLEIGLPEEFRDRLITTSDCQTSPRREIWPSALASALALSSTHLASAYSRACCV